jgi:hypothetical protein
MIVGVPDSQELHDTAVGWFNLAWDIVIKAVEEFQEAVEIFDDMEKSDGPEKVQDEVDKYWKSSRYKLNNAISLLQQALEIALKSRIAEISPYLLIADPPHQWPNPNKAREIDFSDLRTLDAVHLCKVHNKIAQSPLPTQFIQLYDNVRKERNKIAHLHAGNAQAESSTIILVMLRAHKYLYPLAGWMEFRRCHLAAERTEAPTYGSSEDFTNDRLNHEFEALKAELPPWALRDFFGFDPRKRSLKCFNCNDLRTDYSEQYVWDSAQRQKDGSIMCVVCQTTFTDIEYKARVKQEEEDFKKWEARAKASVPRRPNLP